MGAHAVNDAVVADLIGVRVAALGLKRREVPPCRRYCRQSDCDTERRVVESGRELPVAVELHRREVGAAACLVLEISAGEPPPCQRETLGVRIGEDQRTVRTDEIEIRPIVRFLEVAVDAFESVRVGQ